MAVIGAVVGGAVVGAIIYDNHSDHSDYSDYNYSNYSDAAERQKRRQADLEEKISSQEYKINTYKADSVNEHLQSSALKKESGVNVSLSAVKEDGDKKIENDIKTNFDRETADMKVEIKEIDKAIAKIDQVLEGDDYV